MQSKIVYAFTFLDKLQKLRLQAQTTLITEMLKNVQLLKVLLYIMLLLGKNHLTLNFKFKYIDNSSVFCIFMTLKTSDLEKKLHVITF
jgi:hypothetical protein